MVILLIISSLFIVAVLTVAVYFWQKPSAAPDTELLPYSGFQPRGLFSGEDSQPSAPEIDSTTSVDSAEHRASLLERSKQGDRTILLEFRLPAERDDYDAALDHLVDQADSTVKLLSLVSYVTRNELPVNKQLAQQFIEGCKRAPDRGTTAKMLHIAALSDDANLYQQAIENALHFWREGHLTEVTVPELTAILDGEFWLLSSQTRSSGAGFVLKRTLADARRELERAANN